jgi:hypothetical protein
VFLCEQNKKPVAAERVQFSKASNHNLSEDHGIIDRMVRIEAARLGYGGMQRKHLHQGTVTDRCMHVTDHADRGDAVRGLHALKHVGARTNAQSGVFDTNPQRVGNPRLRGVDRGNKRTQYTGHTLPHDVSDIVFRKTWHGGSRRNR